MKLKATLISIISVLIIGLVSIILYCYWPAIKGTVDNSKYYTQEELQESYDKGYNDGCKSETELTGQVKYYKGLVDEYYIQVNTLNDEITMLTNNNQDYKTQVTNLENQKSNLQEQVTNLTTIKTNNETTINDLNNQITSLQNQITKLTNENEDKSEEIDGLNKQISTLQGTVSQLQTTNEMNLQTITSLNNQIANLNNQISEMSLNSSSSQNQINALNNKINDLQQSINYYESYIASLENGEQVVATFEYDGSVYNIQIVNKNSKLTVTTPTSTEYKVFNGWKVNNEFIDLDTYQITTNTKIVADITYKFDVKFMVDETTFNSQIVTLNECATLPTTPTKDGYEFDGWSLNGVDLIEDIDTTKVTENTTYIAVFTKLHTVTFMVDDTTISTQKIRNGNFATSVDVDANEYKVFNGWKVNGTTIDISTYKIVADTIIVADITYKYDVIFMVDSTVYDKQIVTKNECATLPQNPTKDGYEFDGWSLNGVDLIEDLSTIQVTENTTYYAVFEKTYTVTFVVDDTTISTQTIKTGECATVPTPVKSNYKFVGWSINGSDLVENIDTIEVTQNTTYTAVFMPNNFEMSDFEMTSNYDSDTKKTTVVLYSELIKNSLTSNNFENYAFNLTFNYDCSSYGTKTVEFYSDNLETQTLTTTINQFKHLTSTIYAADVTVDFNIDFSSGNITLVISNFNTKVFTTGWVTALSVAFKPDVSSLNFTMSCND